MPARQLAAEDSRPQFAVDLVRQSGARDTVHGGIIRQLKENTKYKIFYLTKRGFGPTHCPEARAAWPTALVAVPVARPKSVAAAIICRDCKSKGRSNGQDRF